MAADRPTKEMPYCTIFLVFGALACHCMVLMGNLSTARMLHDLGKSTSGWSNIGTSLSTAMANELSPAMDQVGSYLSQGIGVMTRIEKGMDIVLSSSGSATDAAMKDFDPNGDLKKFRTRLMSTLETLSTKLMEKVSQLIDKFIELIRPALDQVKDWLVSFGEKIQNALEEFGTTIDRVQKLLDGLMAKVSPSAGANVDDMIYNTFTMLDSDNTGKVVASDLQIVAEMFGIPALSGKKAGELFRKYDDDGNGDLDVDEYALLAQDEDIPGIMPLMLRTYSKKLANVGGALASARMRDEVASEVVHYMTLVCAKNLTRLSWISQALSNGSLALPFTADVMKNFAMDMDNPNKLTQADVGGMVITEMMHFNKEHVLEALNLMADPAFWASEGFDEDDQPPVVQKVVRWIVQAPGGTEALRSDLELGSHSLDADVEGSLPDAAMKVTEQRQAKYLAKHKSDKAGAHGSLYASKASKKLRDNLLGGVGAAAAGENADADSAVNKGVHALPETLVFASWLAANATDRSDTYLADCFEYSGESSGALESFANQINGMIKKVQSFMNMLEKYASVKGIDRLVNEAKHFGTSAVKDILMVAESHIDAEISLALCKSNLGNCTAGEAEQDMPVMLSGAFNFITHTMHELKNVLPIIIEDLKFAKKEVSAVSGSMASVMGVLKGKAPPIFNQVGNLYKALWVAYFVLFSLLTVGLLVYGFWSSGYLGGPQIVADSGYQGPRTFPERIRVCCNSCTTCLRGAHDNSMCFWSVLLLMEVLVLVIFVIAVVICVIGGLQAFMAAGCSQVYILGDQSVCTTSLKIMRTFLKSFWSEDTHPEAAGMSIEETCDNQGLLTCQLISTQLVSAVKMSIVGGLLASVLSFQMLVESAVLHERARWNRMLNEKNAKDV